MKRPVNFLFLLFIAIAAVGCKGTSAVITNGDLELAVDNMMRFRVNSLNDATVAFHDGFIESDAFVAVQFTATQFKVKNVAKSETSVATVHTIIGEYSRDGFTLEKRQTITARNDLPGMALIETSYANTGDKEITVLGWKSNRLRVDSDSPVWAFQPTSSSRRADWLNEVDRGYYKENFLGMNNSDYGGGIPMVYMWRRDGGIATGLAEMVLRQASMPVEWLAHDDYASIGLEYRYPDRQALEPGDTLGIYDTFIAVHTGDFYNPLDQFTVLMESKGMEFPDSNDEAYEAVWCAWGYERTFTINEVIGTLPKVKEMGFKWVDIDDGFQIAEGDWETNERFPGGDRDMRRMTDAVHDHGMKAKLWWAPLAADPGTRVLEENPGVRLTTREGAPGWITWWNSFYMSPVNPITEKLTNDLLERFIVTWNFDGLKLDGQHMNCCMPDYNRQSKLDYPEQAVELMPTYFENIYNKTLGYKDYAVVQFCPCGCAINYFMIPFMNQAVSSDPTSSWQIRHKGKAYRAINDKLAYYADHVELSDNGDDFGTQIGIGGVIGSKFTYPRDNPNVKRSYLLTPEKEKLYKKWVNIYNDRMISKGEYLNLYDIAYDKPEAHVLSKDDSIYYAFYADEWNGEEITLRGLENRTYTVCEYTSDDMKTYTVEGSAPVIRPVFKRNYLIEVY